MADNIKELSGTDDISGDGRAIKAGLHRTTDTTEDPDWVTATEGKKAQFDSYSQEMGSWNLYLKSKKSLPTTASFWGEWTVD